MADTATRIAEKVEANLTESELAAAKKAAEKVKKLSRIQDISKKAIEEQADRNNEWDEVDAISWENKAVTFKVGPIINGGGAGSIRIATYKTEQEHNLICKTCIFDEGEIKSIEQLEEFSILKKLGMLLGYTFEEYKDENKDKKTRVRFFLNNNGLALDSFIENNSPSLIERVSIALYFINNLIYLHKNGILHRDLKPGNILVDPAKQVTIIDFDVSRDLSALISEPQDSIDYSLYEVEQNDLYGTYDYSAHEIKATSDENTKRLNENKNPELLQYKYSIKTDICSAGLVLNFLFFHKKLGFKTENRKELKYLKRIRKEVISPMTAHDPLNRATLEAMKQALNKIIESIIKHSPIKIKESSPKQKKKNSNFKPNTIKKPRSQRPSIIFRNSDGNLQKKKPKKVTFFIPPEAKRTYP